MDNRYDELVSKIMNMRRFGGRTGIEITGKLLDALDHPERDMRVIHVAGTNGKGSTCVFIANMLMKMGFKVGLFTSPHLYDFDERICIAHDNTFTRISRGEVVELAEEILSIEIDTTPTMFDICTVMALLKFKKESCDYVILETGLGGIYDSTTAIACIPRLCVITSIGRDHEEVLGDNLVGIAVNKAGIIVNGTKVVLSHLPQEAREVMLSRCDSLGIDRRDIHSIEEFDYSKYTYIKTLSGYQVTNAKAAILAVHTLVADYADEFITKYMDYCKSSEEHCGSDCAKCTDYDKACELSYDEWLITRINMAINSFYWPGRLEMLSDNVLCDGAHNEEAYAKLADYIKDRYEDKHIIAIIGVLADKKYQEGIRIISPIVDIYYCADVSDDRGLSGKKLAEELVNDGLEAKYIGDERAVADYVYKLIQKNNANSGDKLYNNLYVIMGSLYFVGHVKRILWQLQQE